MRKVNNSGELLASGNFFHSARNAWEALQSSYKVCIGNTHGGGHGINHAGIHLVVALRKASINGGDHFSRQLGFGGVRNDGVIWPQVIANFEV